MQTSTVTQLVVHPLCDWEAVGLIPDRVTQKILKLVLAALLLGTQHQESSIRTGQPVAF